MRMLFALVAIWPISAHAISPPGECADYAAKFSDVLPAFADIAKGLEQIEYWRMIEGRNELKAAVEAADAARESLLDPLRVYIAAMEDLTYQLQRCARG